MYDTKELRDRLALLEEQRRLAVEQLDSARSELRLEKQRTSDLIREKTTAQVQVEDLRRDGQKALADHYADADKITERFRREAIERGWCDEAVEVIRELNECLTAPLGLPDREYVVEATATVYVRRIVRAIDEDGARNVMDAEWREAVSDTDLFEQLVYGGADLQSSSEWHVEEGD
jgi:hypothetical protein